MVAEYKTLEQQIIELWSSRGLTVESETFKTLKNGTLQWIIRAKEEKRR